MWLTRLALRNPVLILMLTLATILLGLTALDRLSVDLFPNVNFPVLLIVTYYPGAGPKDIERSITYPIEKAVSGITGVEHIESNSREGVSSVSVFLNWGADNDAAMVEAANHIQQIINTLPSGVQIPFIIKFDLANFPICAISVSGGGLDERGLFDLSYNTIEPQIEQLAGVASASVNGGKVRQITASLDRERMASMGISMLDVVGAINGANLIEPAGWIKAGNRQYRVSTNAQFKVVDRIADVVVKAPGGVPITVGNLGHVIDGYEPQSNIVRVNGARGVFLSVTKQPGTNTVQIVDEVKNAMRHLVGVPPGVSLRMVFDQSIYIRESISSLRREALQGAFLALLVILLFIQSLRGTVIISLAIPLSILATFLLLYLTGQTLNIFSLGGIALAVGRMVDDSIVELENISRHFSLYGINRQSVLKAAAEVRMPVLASTITTVIVFLPTAFVSGVGKILFMPTAVAVTCSLTASYLVSTTVTPLLCLHFVRPEHEAHQEHRRFSGIARFCRRAIELLEQGYRRSLEAALSHRWVVMTAVGLSVVSAFVVARHVGAEFFPVSDEGQFQIRVRAPIGTRVEETERIVIGIEDEIRRAIPAQWIDRIVSNIGLLTTAGRSSGGGFTPNTGPHSAYIQINLVDADKRSESVDSILARLRPRLEHDFPEVRLYMDPGGLVSHVLNFGYGAAIDVQELGYDLPTAAALAKRVARVMRNTPGLADVQIGREENFPEFDINVDRQKAALAGIYEYSASHLILDSTNGSTQSPSIYIDPRTGNEYNIVAQYQDRFNSHYDDLGETFLTNPLAVGDESRNQGVVRLSTIASIEPGAGPLEIDRRYLQRVIDITGNPVGRDLGSIAASLERDFAAMKLPAGFTVQLGGQIAKQRETFRSLAYAAVLALMLVYMVLASQFHSLMDPFIIMFSVPLGLVGVMWALFLTNTRFSTTAFMGVIMMVGIVVSNGVLLIHYANLLREDGEELHRAVIHASVVRLRPILMTTVATLAGLLPMAIGLAVGSEANVPLARTVIGGLTVSTALTLFFVPALYTSIEERHERRRRRRDA
jgi:CzcA family heavy metal efflux pump